MYECLGQSVDMAQAELDLIDMRTDRVLESINKINTAQTENEREQYMQST